MSKGKLYNRKSKGEHQIKCDRRLKSCKEADSNIGRGTFGTVPEGDGVRAKNTIKKPAANATRRERRSAELLWQKERVSEFEVMKTFVVSWRMKGEGINAI